MLKGGQGPSAAAARPRLSISVAGVGRGATARRLGLWTPAPPQRADIRLERDASGRYALRDLREPRARPIAPDFSRIPGGLDRGGRRAQPIARAIGVGAGTVVDATAGLGNDAWLLACLGYRVIAIERCAVLALLLKAASRDRRARPLRRIVPPRVLVGDARVLLPGFVPAPDTIYIDTMFQQPRGRSARSRRGMLLVRELVGDDADVGELLAVALSVARDRVVVKRARHAPALEPRPVHAIVATSVRYDVYPVRGRRVLEREAGG